MKIDERDLIRYMASRSTLSDDIRSHISAEVCKEGSQVDRWYQDFIRRARATESDINWSLIAADGFEAADYEIHEGQFIVRSDRGLVRVGVTSGKAAALSQIKSLHPHYELINEHPAYIFTPSHSDQQVDRIAKRVAILMTGLFTALASVCLILYPGFQRRLELTEKLAESHSALSVSSIGDRRYAIEGDTRYPLDVNYLPAASSVPIGWATYDPRNRHKFNYSGISVSENNVDGFTLELPPEIDGVLWLVHRNSSFEIPVSRVVVTRVESNAAVSGGNRVSRDAKGTAKAPMNMVFPSKVHLSSQEQEAEDGISGERVTDDSAPSIIEGEQRGDTLKTPNDMIQSQIESVLRKWGEVSEVRLRSGQVVVLQRGQFYPEIEFSYRPDVLDAAEPLPGRSKPSDIAVLLLRIGGLVGGGDFSSDEVLQGLTETCELYRRLDPRQQVELENLLQFAFPSYVVSFSVVSGGEIYLTFTPKGRAVFNSRIESLSEFIEKPLPPQTVEEPSGIGGEAPK